VVSCWLTIALADVEHPVQRLVTRSHVRRTPAMVASVVLPLCVLLAVVSEAWALLVHVRSRHPSSATGCLRTSRVP
jgi:hypothetical protein